jgi:Uma2 family endonuclease
MDLPAAAGIFDSMQSASAPAPLPAPPAHTVRLVIDVPAAEDAWVLPEEDMPESNPHRAAVDLLRLLLLAFVARTRRDALVAANLACRWNRDKPQIGVDPDVALIEPAPPGAAELSSLRTWEPGHVPPRFAVEVVSENNSSKDYEDAPAKYAVLGTRELVVFDPQRLGPTALGGPFILQVWRRSEDGTAMVRTYAGDGPARSEELGAWLVVTERGQLRFAEAASGERRWPTAEEAALQTAVEDLCEVLDVPLNDTRRAHVANLDAAGLDALRAHLKRARTWPA